MFQPVLVWGFRGVTVVNEYEKHVESVGRNGRMTLSLS